MENNGLLNTRSARFLFLHVPKTAGSMFRTVVKQNFGKEAVVENPYMSDQVYSARQIDRLFYLYPYRFFLGHVFRLKSALKACDGAVQLISFSRDPVDKALSAYHYLKGRNMTNPDHPVKNKTFIEMVDYVLAREDFDSFDLDSSQIDWLVGEKGASVSEVEQAVTSGRLALFPTEDFDFACLILERMFPNDFKDCSYVGKVNASRRANKISSEERRAAERLPWIKKDRELHALAQKNVRQLADILFPTQEELQRAKNDFESRCKQKAYPSLQNAKSRSLVKRTREAIKVFLQ